MQLLCIPQSCIYLPVLEPIKNIKTITAGRRALIVTRQIDFVHCELPIVQNLLSEYGTVYRMQYAIAIAGCRITFYSLVPPGATVSMIVITN